LKEISPSFGIDNVIVFFIEISLGILQ
jgi:hypothetical protein